MEVSQFYYNMWVHLLLFYVHGKHLWSCWDGQLTSPHFFWPCGTRQNVSPNIVIEQIIFSGSLGSFSSFLVI